MVYHIPYIMVNVGLSQTVIQIEKEGADTEEIQIQLRRRRRSLENKVRK